jgi:chromosome segregation ATPase
MGQPFPSRPFPIPATEAPAELDSLLGLNEQLKAAKFMASRAFDELRKSNDARRALERDHNMLLAHSAELLDRCQRLQKRLAQLEDPEGYHEDQVAAWLKNRGWLVSRPITIEGQAT